MQEEAESLEEGAEELRKRRPRARSSDPLAERRRTRGGSSRAARSPGLESLKRQPESPPPTTDSESIGGLQDGGRQPR